MSEGCGKSLGVGAQLAGPVRTMVPYRIKSYEEGMRSSITGVYTPTRQNHHSDDKFAQSQGLKASIADGMISTNWISSLLLQQFGMDYLERGELRTKYIKPIYIGTLISTHARVRSTELLDGGAIRYVLDVWCEDDKGVKLTVGDAKVEVAPRQ